MPNTDTQDQRALVRRWGGHPELFRDGFVGVPSTLLAVSGKLEPKLTPADVLLVLNLMAFKWDEKAPFPSYRTLAERMGVSVAYARKLAASLEKKGYLVREARIGASNQFNLSPLFERLAAYVNR